MIIMFCAGKKRKLGYTMTHRSNDSSLVCFSSSAASTITATENYDIVSNNTVLRHEVSKRRRHGSKEESELSRITHNNFATTSQEEIDERFSGLDPDGPDTPDEFLRKLLSFFFNVEIEESQTIFTSASEGFFAKPLDDEMLSYSALAPATRANNVSELLHLSKDGYSLNCCNRFGESLLHIACRRAFVEIVRLILDQPGVSVRIVDDCGRTPLHDLCWNPSPQLEICKWILEREPSLFLLKDKRKFSPFDYTRQEHWGIWKRFLLENKELFKKMESDCYGFLKREPVVDIQRDQYPSNVLQSS